MGIFLYEINNLSCNPLCRLSTIGPCAIYYYGQALAAINQQAVLVSFSYCSGGAKVKGFHAVFQIPAGALWSSNRL